MQPSSTRPTRSRNSSSSSAILGLAGALLVPRLINADTFTVQAAVRSVIADITFAQTDALAMQKVRRFQFLRDDNDRIHGYAILAPSNPALYDGPFNAETAEYLDHPSASRDGRKFHRRFRSRGLALQGSRSPKSPSMETTGWPLMPLEARSEGGSHAAPAGGGGSECAGPAGPI